MRKFRDFTLRNQDGEEVTLSEELKNNHAWLIFYRGNFWGAWLRELSQVVENYQRILDCNTKVYAISTDGLEGTKEFYERIDSNFDFLSDEDAETVNLYEMANSSLHKKKYYNGEQIECEPRTISLCGNVLINKNGKELFYQKGVWSIRPGIEDMIQQIRFMSGEDDYIDELRKFLRK